MSQFMLPRCARRVSSWQNRTTAFQLLLLCLFWRSLTFASAATLAVESAGQPKDWSPFPVDASQVTPDGRLIVPTTASSEFFRLLIAEGDGPVRPTASVPEAARTLALEFLARRQASLVGAAEPAEIIPELSEPLELGPVAAVYHDYSVTDGSTPAYVEFKLVRARPSGRPVAGAIFGGGPLEVDSRIDAGHLTVSLTRFDQPICDHAFAGSARFERLLARAAGGNPVARLVRFDDTFLVAEDAAGKVVASLGSAPYLPDPVLLNVPEEGFEAEIGPTGLAPSTGPQLQARQPASYAAFVNEWRTNAVIRRYLEARVAAAAEAWQFAGEGPKTVTLDLRQSVILNPSGPAGVRAASSADNVIRVEIEAASGRVTATALAAGEALVTIWQADGSSSVCVVETSDPASGPTTGRLAPHGLWVPGKKAGWYLSKERRISTWDEQRHYDQIWKDPDLCAKTVSGCGPTAWAMYYGYWDRHGYPRLFAGNNLADSPQTIGSNFIYPSVHECIKAVFDAVGEICFEKLDRAATLPNLMDRGLQWAVSRGVGTVGTIHWGVPGVSPGSQKKALDSLDAGRISIVGIGFYSHYPVAYGYQRWEYRGRYGTVWVVDYNLLLNLGWGPGQAPEWRNIKQLWYATNIQPK